LPNHEFEHLVVYIPEATTKNQAMLNNIKEIVNTLRHFEGLHSVKKIHILAFFMGSHIPTAL
jgi:hypothetical protein